MKLEFRPNSTMPVGIELICGPPGWPGAVFTLTLWGETWDAWRNISIDEMRAIRDWIDKALDGMTTDEATERAERKL